MPAIYDKVRKRFDRGIRLAQREWSKVGYPSAKDAMPAFDHAILAGLEKTGTVVTNIAELAAAGYQDIGTVLDFGPRLFQSSVPGQIDKDYVEHVENARIEATPEPLLWPLRDRFINIIEAYLGGPAAYRGMTARRDVANGRATGTRLWHRDGEDARIVKIIVYLNDVECADDGPFEYIPRDALPASAKLNIFDGNRVSDADMNAVVPGGQQKLCTGMTGTVVFTDTCSVYHKGAVGKRRDRYTLFYAFNSRYPLEPEHCTALFDVDRLKKNARLTQRQQGLIAYLPPAHA